MSIPTSRLCFSTLGCSDYTPAQTAALAARLGITQLEIRGLCGTVRLAQEEAFDERHIAQTLAPIRTAGQSILVYGSSLSGNNLAAGVQTDADVLADIALAQRMGARYLRVFPDKLRDMNDREEIRAIARAIGHAATLAQASGITVLMEIHGHLNRIETVAPLLEVLGDHPAFGILWDIQHSDKIYGDGWEPFYQLIRPHIRHVHIKDHLRPSHRLTLPGQGDIPIRAIVERLLADGYAGCFSLEWERLWHPELPPIETALSHFIDIMQQCRTACKEEDA